MTLAWRDVGPVIISILIIIAVAIARTHSRALAAVLATMPINVPLALWVVYSGVGGDQAAVTEFTGAMIIGIAATVMFLFVVWLASRAGWSLVPMLAAGYLVWGVCLGLTLGVRHLLAR